MTQIDQFFFRQLKVRHLHLLVALADLPTVERVAKLLHVTQPAVSRMIADLERGLGVALFEKDGRRIRPTGAGAHLVRHARDMLAQAQRASDTLSALANGLGGRLEVGMLSVASPVLLPRATVQFKSRAPTTTVALHEGTLDRLLPALQSGRLDLVVGRIAKDTLDDATLSFEALFDDPSVIVAAREHPLARFPALAWADLAGAAWILPTVSAPMHRRLLSVLARHGLPPPSDVIECDNDHVSLIRDSQRLAIMPRSLATRLVVDAAFWIAPLELGTLLGPVGMVWRDDVAAPTALAVFQDCLRAVAAAMAFESDG
ncbi:LysR substrate-binding domain-containing protein [Chitinasiproducens palmae]|uniref:DNA-binding transcriptional regulator, LysR family n=1 Tax=Chitinasiproducens palmae TaxID=1770053 RepID=A0A1H2PKK4_9BURK|nr:LysR substrate-binding domain-containing protein [Chitinasiproducens palmae]SDV46481.1 DNA-binding transcriptional regulator, LysR family [Chitinasiproducens palmae]